MQHKTPDISEGFFGLKMIQTQETIMFKFKCTLCKLKKSNKKQITFKEVRSYALVAVTTKITVFCSHYSPKGIS